LISTHNLDEARRIANRVAVLRRRLLALDSRARCGPPVRGRGGGHVGAVSQTVWSLRAVSTTCSYRAMSVGVADGGARTGHRAGAGHGGADVAVAAADPPLEDVYLRLLDGDGA
jgi:hypothetical protein